MKHLKVKGRVEIKFRLGRAKVKGNVFLSSGEEVLSNNTMVYRCSSTYQGVMPQCTHWKLKIS